MRALLRWAVAAVGLALMVLAVALLFVASREIPGADRSDRSGGLLASRVIRGVPGITAE